MFQFNDTLIHEKSFATAEIYINYLHLKTHAIKQLLSLHLNFKAWFLQWRFYTWLYLSWRLIKTRDKKPALLNYDHQGVQPKASSLQPWDLISIGLDTRVPFFYCLWVFSNISINLIFCIIIIKELRQFYYKFTKKTKCI